MNFLLSLSPDTERDSIDALNDLSGYVDDISNIDNIYFHNMIHLIYTPERILIRASSSNVEA